MKHLLFFLALLTTHLIFSQDPSCEYHVTLKDVQSDVYDYEIIIEDQPEKLPIDTITKLIGNNVFQSLGFAFFKTQDGKEIILGFKRDNCYPNSEIEEQLRVVIARKNKKTEEIEVMYFTAPMLIKTEIEIEKFQEEKRDVDIYKFDHFVKENQDNNRFWYNIALEATQKIVVK